MSPGHMEPIIGRYIKVPVMGEDCRVYFEEAGQGIPLVCLHTAGADSRQFRHLRCDEAVTKDFRVIAFDLPWHGKSYPPVGWEKREYRLATDLYVATIRAFCAALGFETSRRPWMFHRRPDRPPISPCPWVRVPGFDRSMVTARNMQKSGHDYVFI